jgi:NAD(P)H-hydrate epimerase
MLKQYLPPRARQANKSDFGHVLIIGGDYGMPGAARMTGEAAARIGAGLVSVATRPEHIAAVNSMRPELMCHGIKKINNLNALLTRATVIALGPGLGQSLWSKKLFQKTLTSALPKVLDADALNLLAQKPSYRENWILTPHPGEAARLLKTTVAHIQADRTTAARQLQKQYGGVIVLKGSNSIVINTDGNITTCPFGNPGMASGGMGDVLTGIIAGLLAQGLTFFQAAESGVFLHAIAGDEAAKDGERGMLAMDLMPYLRKNINL